MAYNKMNSYKKGKISLNLCTCPTCGSYMTQIIKPDLSGKDYVCTNCNKSIK